jgi:hypothetical protein
MNGKAGTAKADRAVTGRGRVGDHRDLERQRREECRRHHMTRGHPGNSGVEPVSCENLWRDVRRASDV